jgi:outer membrane lipoprotein-sorting protein
VRELVPVEAYQSLLDTDLTYADLGYVDQQGTYHLLGEEEHNGVQTYKLEFIPDQQVFYSRIMTWVAVDTMLPVQRDYYDLAGKLWKTMTFDQVKTIDGIPTPLHIRVHDVRRDTSTDVTFSKVRYDVDLSERLFDPDHLPQTVEVRWVQPRDTRIATGE